MAVIDRQYWTLPSEVSVQPLSEKVLLDKRLKFNASKADRCAPTDAFSKDWDRIPHLLYYDGQSIAERHLVDWQPVKATSKIIGLLDSDEDEAQLVRVEQGAETEEKKLKDKVAGSLNDYLDRKLGNTRAGLKSEIFWRFSQKALTQITAIAAPILDKRFNGQLVHSRDPHLVESSIKLIVPDDQNKRVKIIALYRCRYDQFIPNGGGPEPLKIQTPIDFVGEAVYSIRYKKGWFGKTQIPESVVRMGFKVSQSRR